MKCAISRIFLCFLLAGSYWLLIIYDLFVWIGVDVIDSWACSCLYYRWRDDRVTWHRVIVVVLAWLVIWLIAYNVMHQSLYPCFVLSCRFIKEQLSLRNISSIGITKIDKRVWGWLIDARVAASHGNILDISHLSLICWQTCSWTIICGVCTEWWLIEVILTLTFLRCYNSSASLLLWENVSFNWHGLLWVGKLFNQIISNKAWVRVRAHPCVFIQCLRLAPELMLASTSLATHIAWDRLTLIELVLNELHLLLQDLNLNC